MRYDSHRTQKEEKMKVARFLNIGIAVLFGGALALVVKTAIALEETNKALKPIGPKPCLYPLGEGADHDEHELCGVGAM